MEIKPIGPEWATYIATQQRHLYPEAMWEEAAIFKELLKHPLGIGAIADEVLMGWILAQQENPHTVYIYDSAVLPEYQGKGLFWKMRGVFLDRARWQGLDVHSHARHTSYRVASDAKFLFEHGYEIVSDRYIPNHYETEYEDESLHGEDAHEIYIRPIGIFRG